MRVQDALGRRRRARRIDDESVIGRGDLGGGRLQQLLRHHVAETDELVPWLDGAAALVQPERDDPAQVREAAGPQLARRRAAEVGAQLDELVDVRVTEQRVCVSSSLASE
jgi:hypothetical protein